MTDGPEGALEALAAELEEALCVGFDEAQMRWAASSLRDVVLPSVWDDEADDPTDASELRALVGSLSACSPQERWADLVLAHYVSLLRPLQMAAVVLGVKADRSGDDDRGWLAIEAEGVIAMLQALSDEIEASSPSTHELLREDFDAAMVDCDYVRNRGVMSPYLEAALSSRSPD